jgi:hypothetical protein
MDERIRSEPQPVPATRPLMMNCQIPEAFNIPKLRMKCVSNFKVRHIRHPTSQNGASEQSDVSYSSTFAEEGSVPSYETASVV